MLEFSKCKCDKVYKRNCLGISAHSRQIFSDIKTTNSFSTLVWLCSSSRLDYLPHRTLHYWYAHLIPLIRHLIVYV